MSDPLDQGIRELVREHGLDRTLFVEAGAGTGKTRQLVERIGNLVLSRGVRLSHIAAITFTEAAAAELRTRIRVHFEKALAAPELEGVRRERARQALLDLDLAALSTLHGFANRLLGEFAIDAGLPPRVHVRDEVSSQLAFEERWERFSDGLYADPDNEVLLERAELIGVAIEPRYPNQASLKDVAAELDDNWDRLLLLPATDLAPLAPVDVGPMEEAVLVLERRTDECTDPSDLLFCKLVDEIVPEARALLALDPDRRLRSLVALERAGGWKKGAGGKAASWGGDAKAIKGLVDELNEAVRAVVREAGDEVLRHLLARVRVDVLAAAEARRREGGLEYHDLLVWARETLRTNRAARHRLHDRFTHLLLDEFQDTDPLQVELAVLIAAAIEGDADGRVAGRWTEHVVDDGRLFFVGDPKQSIYRFRRADIALYLEARDRFGGDESCVRLSTNFRTVEPVLDWINALFGSLIVEVEVKQPAYEPLSPWRDSCPDTDHRPVLLGGPDADPSTRAGDLRTAEAADVARVVADIGDRPGAWPVYDEALERWRDARLDDVAILLPTRTSLSYLRDALDERDLPYRLATGTLVYDTQEVRDALAALRAIADTTDELSLVAALRSPLYACSDVDLFTYRQAGGRWALHRDPPDAVPVDHPVRLALAHLRELWEQRWWHPPSALLDRLLRERHAALLAFGEARHAEVWHRLRFLVDQARAFEVAEGGDLRSFLAWASLQGADRARVHEPLLPETDDRAVRILTIHGAKGLEFPITILSGMTTEPGAGRYGVSLLWTDRGEPEVRMRKGLATANHEPTADLEAEMDEHEKVRLLYVAATRARDHLVVACHHKEGGKPTYAKRIWDELVDQPDLWRALSDAVADEPSGARGTGDEAPTTPVAQERGAWEAERGSWAEARTALLESQRVARVVSATAVARSVNAVLGSEPIEVDETDLTTDVGGARGEGLAVRRRGRAGTAVGRAVHATLQVVDLADPRDLEAQVRRQCDIEAIPDLTGTVAALVQSALDSDVVRRAASSSHHREIYVAAPVGDRVVEGYIDLLIDTPDGLLVVDYKTDSVDSDAAVDAKLASYELQAATYAVALEAVTGRPVTECRFVFCRQAGAIERAVTDLPAAMARVRDAVQGPDTP